MRYIEIDGQRVEVSLCDDCPCYDGGDGGWGERCKHPKGDGESAPLGGYSHGEDIRYGPNCPLRKVPQ